MTADPHTAAVRLLELSGKATAGPWEAIDEPTSDDDNFARSIYGPADDYKALLVARADQQFSYCDAAFIAAARNDLPAICEALLRMEAALREIWLTACDAAESADETAYAILADFEKHGFAEWRVVDPEENEYGADRMMFWKGYRAPRTPQADGET